MGEQNPSPALRTNAEMKLSRIGGDQHVSRTFICVSQSLSVSDLNGFGGHFAARSPRPPYARRLLISHWRSSP